MSSSFGDVCFLRHDAWPQLPHPYLSALPTLVLFHGFSAPLTASPRNNLRFLGVLMAAIVFALIESAFQYFCNV